MREDTSDSAVRTSIESVPKKTLRGRVTSLSWKGHLKRIRLDVGGVGLSLPRSACVTTGDTVEVSPSGSAWVVCPTGEKAKIYPEFETPKTLVLGNRSVEIQVKEITTPVEFDAYENLATLHYRNQAKHGRASVLVARAKGAEFPPILGYIELASPFYMSKPRADFFGTTFRVGDINWEVWNAKTTKQYLGLFVRISRCVVSPEFRGLGLGAQLLDAAAQFAKGRWHHSGHRPMFLEISADMLRFVPFAQKAGFTYIGDTEGNLGRVARDIDYLTKNARRVRSKEIVREDSFGIVDQQVSRMKTALRLMRRHGISRGELVRRLENLNRGKVLKEFAMFSEIVSLPKPMFVRGLTSGASRFVSLRAQHLQRTQPSPANWQAVVSRIKSPIRLKNVTASFASRIRRNSQTHAIQQAFGISPENLTCEVLRGVSLIVEPGEIVVITGPSGAGKTVLLDVIAGTARASLTVSGGVRRPSNMIAGYLRPLSSRKSLIEIFGIPDVESGIRLLSQVGLADAYLYLRRFKELSAGQQYRAMLADLIRRGCNVAIIDEFCSTLDPITAHTVAVSLAKMARNTGLTAVLAAPHISLFVDGLQPDQLITVSSFGRTAAKIDKQ